MSDDGVMNSFDTGATRDTSEGKLVFDKFLSPKVLLQFAKYMNMNRLQSDGQMRDGDNWQKGIPMDKYMESAYRHFFDWWLEHRGYETDAGLMAALCGLLFNTMGYMHEMLKHDPRAMQDFDGEEPTPEMKERQEKVAAAAITVGSKDFPCHSCLSDDCLGCEIAEEELAAVRKPEEQHVICRNCISTDKLVSQFPCSDCIRLKRGEKDYHMTIDEFRNVVKGAQ